MHSLQLAHLLSEDLVSELRFPSAGLWRCRRAFSGRTTPKWRCCGELLEVKIADPRAPVETAVRVRVFGGVPKGAVIHWINGH